jgi:hypothetical protein
MWLRGTGEFLLLRRNKRRTAVTGTDLLRTGIFLTTITPVLLPEYSDAGLRIPGKPGVLVFDPVGAREVGFIVWSASGLNLIAP